MREQIWDAECAGKEAYTSESTAEFILARIRAEPPVGMRGTCWLSTYQCRFCQAWHIGHSKGAKG